MRNTTALLILLAALTSAGAPLQAGGLSGTAPAGPAPVFGTADVCFACHTGVITPSGRDLSFGNQWRTTMMANSARDPYWMAGVRREITDHPSHQAAIEDECSACHMPMARYLAKTAGGQGAVFANLPVGQAAAAHAPLAADGVSCTLCHQMSAAGLGQRSTFTAGFGIDAPATGAAPLIHGPFDVDAGRRRIMHSSSGYTPAKAAHLSEAGVCASCHTLFTASLGPNGEVVGELPEQVPYLEWEHSAYAGVQSCQACHMPAEAEPVAVTPVLGDPRPAVSAHTFLGGNTLMMRIFNRYRGELGVAALPEELDAAARRTEAHLASESATIAVTATRADNGCLVADVEVVNRAGHKLPTAYPSRRAWLHVAVRDRSGAVVFESGAVSPDGRIAGNDNDADAARFEPHYDEITAGDQVQVYEPILGDPAGAVTTGLLTAVSYLKDNRLLPRGFDKRTAPKDVAVHGSASADDDFAGGGDRIRYAMDMSGATGPFTVSVRLYYQSIGYRWAKNLAGRTDAESVRFTRYYDAMAAGSAVVLAEGYAKVE
ncbi:MAG TPA: hypothetical protein PLK89_04495 [Acidobacteriota bacterium]|nr:hypothetical protein [Acidobacteriota bacterium]